MHSDEVDEVMAHEITYRVSVSGKMVAESSVSLWAARVISLWMK